jgi:type I restriction enzyme R subunit
MPTPEERARQEIDQLHEAAEWQEQDRNSLSLAAARGVVMREFPLRTGLADSTTLVGREAAGVIEAKPEGTCSGGRLTVEYSTRAKFGQ